jgi:secreted PhoX family phosphatase
MKISRREFLGETGSIALGLLVSGSIFSNERFKQNEGIGYGYGPLRKDRKLILDLPKGFSYKIIAKAREKMDDGFYVPGLADGMATFPGPDGTTILMINHEFRIGYPESMGPFKGKKKLMKQLDEELIYDIGKDGKACLSSVTTLVYDTQNKKKISHHLSLVGTLSNCGGGATPQNSMIICEECCDILGKRHGYAFEVPASCEPGITKPIPLKAMGRFKREGIAMVPETGIIYQTEDQVDSLFYRFIPDNPQKLTEGGRLQCLAALDNPQLDTRNWKVQKFPPGETFEVYWIDLKDPDTEKDDLRQRGHSKGAALFGGGEGMFLHDGTVYFVCTNGGTEAKGQIWKYVPSPYEGTPQEKESPGKLELFVEPNDPKVLDHPDQLTVAQNGDIFVCEDGDDTQYMIGITQEREIFKFAKNAKNESEMSGVCFSPDSSTMFVNILASGMTYAITGPWRKSVTP